MLCVPYDGQARLKQNAELELGNYKIDTSAFEDVDDLVAMIDETKKDMKANEKDIKKKKHRGKDKKKETKEDEKAKDGTDVNDESSNVNAEWECSPTSPAEGGVDYEPPGVDSLPQPEAKTSTSAVCRFGFDPVDQAQQLLQDLKQQDLKLQAHQQDLKLQDLKLQDMKLQAQQLLQHSVPEQPLANCDLQNGAAHAGPRVNAGLRRDAAEFVPRESRRSGDVEAVGGADIPWLQLPAAPGITYGGHVEPSGPGCSTTLANCDLQKQADCEMHCDLDKTEAGRNDATANNKIESIHMARIFAKQADDDDDTWSDREPSPCVVAEIDLDVTDRLDLRPIDPRRPVDNAEKPKNTETTEEAAKGPITNPPKPEQPKPEQWQDQAAARPSGWRYFGPPEQQQDPAAAKKRPRHEQWQDPAEIDLDVTDESEEPSYREDRHREGKAKEWQNDGGPATATSSNGRVAERWRPRHGHESGEGRFGNRGGKAREWYAAYHKAKGFGYDAEQRFLRAHPKPR